MGSLVMLVGGGGLELVWRGGFWGEGREGEGGSVRLRVKGFGAVVVAGLEVSGRVWLEVVRLAGGRGGWGVLVALLFEGDGFM